MHMYDNDEFFVAWLEEKVFNIGEEDVYTMVRDETEPATASSRDIPIFWPSGEW